MPAPVSTAAASSAKSADRCRASHPMTTAIRAVPPAGEAPAVRPAPASPEAPGAREAGGRCSCSQPASAAVAALTTARFIRFGPAPTWPRSPAVPNSRRPVNRSVSSASAIRPGSPPCSQAASRAPNSARSPGSGSSRIQASTWERRPAGITASPRPRVHAARPRVHAPQARGRGSGRRRRGSSGCDLGQDAGEQGAHPARGLRPGRDDLAVVQPAFRQTGGQVGHQRDGEHLRT